MSIGKAERTGYGEEIKRAKETKMVRDVGRDGEGDVYRVRL